MRLFYEKLLEPWIWKFLMQYSQEIHNFFNKLFDNSFWIFLGTLVENLRILNRNRRFPKETENAAKTAPPTSQLAPPRVLRTIYVNNETPSLQETEIATNEEHDLSHFGKLNIKLRKN